MRERDSMTQIRVSIDSLSDLVSVWIAHVPYASCPPTTRASVSSVREIYGLTTGRMLWSDAESRFEVVYSATKKDAPPAVPASSSGPVVTSTCGRFSRPSVSIATS